MDNKIAHAETDVAMICPECGECYFILPVYDSLDRAGSRRVKIAQGRKWWMALARKEYDKHKCRGGGSD